MQWARACAQEIAYEVDVRKTSEEGDEEMADRREMRQEGGEEWADRRGTSKLGQ